MYNNNYLKLRLFYTCTKNIVFCLQIAIRKYIAVPTPGISDVEKALIS